MLFPKIDFLMKIVQLIIGYIPPHQFSGRSGVLTPNDLTLVQSIINQVSPQRLCEYAFGQMQIKNVDNDIFISLLKFCCDDLEINERFHAHEIKLTMNKIRDIAGVLNNFEPHNVIQLKNIFKTFSHLSGYHSCLANKYLSVLEMNYSRDLASELQQNESHKKFLSTDEHLRNRYAVVGKCLKDNKKYEVRAYLEKESHIGNTIFFIVPENSVLGAYNEHGRRTPQFSARIASYQDQKMLKVSPMFHQGNLDENLIQVMIEVFRQNAMKILYVPDLSTVSFPSIRKAIVPVDYSETDEFRICEAVITAGKSILTTTGGILPELDVNDMDQEAD